MIKDVDYLIIQVEHLLARKISTISFQDGLDLRAALLATIESALATANSLTDQLDAGNPLIMKARYLVDKKISTTVFTDKITVGSGSLDQLFSTTISAESLMDSLEAETELITETL